mgnify:CR=1 FL=1
MDGHNGFKSKRQAEWGFADACFKASYVSPQCRLKLLVLIRFVRIDDFPKYSFECLVSAFCEPISLGIVRCATGMKYCIMLFETSNDFINKVLPLVTDDFNGAAEPTLDIFV